jgi:TPR repeat protein
VTIIKNFIDDGRRGFITDVRMVNVDPYWISIANTGVIVKKSKPLTFLLALTFLFLFGGSSVVFADDLNDGIIAYKKKDYKTAHRLWVPLGEQGDSFIQYFLGKMYDKGQGVPQDYKEAGKWYRLSAEQGDESAQSNLGVMYSKGRGVLQDYKEAFKWYRLSAEQGFATAQYNLGNSYFNGKGVPQDYKEALKWYRLSAEQGFATAQYNLGVIFKDGHGVPQDYVLGHMWSNLSASNGSKHGLANRKWLENKMTTQQIEEAQGLARNWKPKK